MRPSSLDLRGVPRSVRTGYDLTRPGRVPDRGLQRWYARFQPLERAGGHLIHRASPAPSGGTAPSSRTTAPPPGAAARARARASPRGGPQDRGAAGAAAAVRPPVVPREMKVRHGSPLNKCETVCRESRVVPWLGRIACLRRPACWPSSPAIPPRCPPGGRIRPHYPGLRDDATS